MLIKLVAEVSIEILGTVFTQIDLLECGIFGMRDQSILKLGATPSRERLYRLTQRSAEPIRTTGIIPTQNSETEIF